MWLPVTDTEPREGQYVVFGWDDGLDTGTVGFRCLENNHWLYSDGFMDADQPKWYLILPRIPKCGNL